MSNPRPWLLVLAAVLLAGCGTEKGAQASGTKQGKGPGGSKEPPTLVAVEPAARGTVVARYSTTATLEAENRAQILGRTQGVVQSLLHEEGDEVRGGEELLRLEDDAARLRLQQAEVVLTEQASVFARQKASFEQQVISKADFDLAQANHERAKVERDLAAHELSYTRVRAPFTGTVVRRLVEVGQTVNAGTPLFEIANFKPLLARIHVPAKEMGSLGVGQEVELVLDSSGDRLPGVVRLVSPVIDPTSGTVKVTVHVSEYPRGTRPGDFAHVHVVTQRHENVLRVQSPAVFEDRGEQVVYVAADSVANRRPVQVGFIDETHTEILSGLAENERVVVKGQRSLRDGGPIRVLDSAATAQASAATAARGGS